MNKIVAIILIIYFLLCMFSSYMEYIEKSAYKLVSFDNASLSRYSNYITVGPSVKVFRYINDFSDLTTTDGFLGAIEINKYNPVFISKFTPPEEYFEVLVMETGTQRVLKVLPRCSDFSMSVPGYSSRVVLPEGKYIVWLRLFSDKYSTTWLNDATQSRNPLKIGNSLYTSNLTELDFRSDGLTNLSLEVHHDLHRRQKKGRVESKQVGIVPYTPYVQGYHLEFYIEPDQLGILYIDIGYLSHTTFNSLEINGEKKTMSFIDSSPCKLLRIPPERNERTKVRYTQYVSGVSPKYRQNKPFADVYGEDISHFAEEDSSAQYE